MTSVMSANKITFSSFSTASSQIKFELDSQNKCFQLRYNMYFYIQGSTVSYS